MGTSDSSPGSSPHARKISTFSSRIRSPGRSHSRLSFRAPIPRVPVELIFDQSIGHVFVTRVAGNVASAEIIASLEYGAAVLGTKTILVLAHSGCGAVKAALEGKAVPGQISTLYRLIRPAIDRAGGDLTVAEKVNAMVQAALLRDASPVLAEMVKQGTLSVAAGYYDLGTGRVTLLS